MRTTVRPQIDAIEAGVEMVEEEEIDQNLEDEMVIVLVGVAGAEEIKITTVAPTVLAVVLEHGRCSPARRRRLQA